MRAMQSALAKARSEWATAPTALRAVIWLALLTIALFSWDWVWQTYQQNQADQSKHYDQTLYTGPVWIKVRRLWHWLEANDKPLLIVFTFGLFVFTYRLWASTAELVMDAGDKSKRELRAYISAVPFELPCFMPDRPVQVKFFLTNHGKTPAHDFRISCKVVVWPFPLPQNWDFGGGYTAVPGAPIVFPNAQRVVTSSSDDVLPRETVRDIVEVGNRRLYVVGVVQYRDAFRADQQTTFCASVVPNLALQHVSEGQEVKTGIVFQDSDQHNDAT